MNSTSLQPDQKKRLCKLLHGGIILLAVGLAYAAFCLLTDLRIPCVFRTVTGLKCPGCGITTACLSLLSFDFQTAFLSNVGLFILSPLFITCAVLLLFKYVKTGSLHLTGYMHILRHVLLLSFLVWGVLRNCWAI